MIDNLYTFTSDVCNNEKEELKLHKCLPKDVHPGPDIQVKIMQRYHYIYCYGYNITIGKKELVCSDFVFSLSIVKWFNLPDYTFNREVIDYKIEASELMREMHISHHTYNMTNP